MQHLRYYLCSTTVIAKYQIKHNTALVFLGYGIYPIIGIVGAIVVGMIVLVIAIYLIQRCRSSPFSHTGWTAIKHSYLNVITVQL